MAGETVITIIGNLTADPELRYTQQGRPVANLTIASTPRNFDRQANEWKDGEALFMRCSIWQEMAEHVAATLTKGMRVMAQGRLKQRSYQDKEGNQRTVIELEIDEIGPSLRYATAQVTRAVQGQGGQQGGQQQNGYAPQQGQQGPPQQQAQQGPPMQGPPQGQGYQQGPPQQGYQQGPPQGQQPPQQQFQQGPPQQAQQPQPGTQQAAQQGQWPQAGAQQGFDQTPF